MIWPFNLVVVPLHSTFEKDRAGIWCDFCQYIGQIQTEAAVVWLVEWDSLRISQLIKMPLPVHVPRIIKPLLLCWDESFFVSVQSGY